MQDTCAEAARKAPFPGRGCLALYAVESDLVMATPPHKRRRVQAGNLDKIDRACDEATGSLLQPPGTWGSSGLLSPQMPFKRDAFATHEAACQPATLATLSGPESSHAKPVLAGVDNEPHWVSRPATPEPTDDYNQRPSLRSTVQEREVEFLLSQSQPTVF